MATPHGTSACSLPLCIQDLKCSYCDRQMATRICLGCYIHYCFECYKKHRREISAQFDHIIHDSDIVLQAILPTITRDAEQHVFNPVQLRKEISDCHDKLEAKVNHATRRAFRSLKTLMDERSDNLVNRIHPIQTQLKSCREFKNYIDAHLDRFKQELRAANNKIEHESPTTVHASIDGACDIDWNNLIEMQLIEHEQTGQTLRTSIINELHFDYLAKGHAPFKHLANQGRGHAIAASDHLVIFVRDGEELCIVKSHADYRTIIPLSRAISSAVRPVDIIDLCWSSATSLFIVLTSTQLFTLSPNRKILKHIPSVRPPDEHQFSSCTCSGNKLLVCYSGHGSPIQEWSTTDWEQGRCWNPPISCGKDKNIECIRFSQNGTLVGVAVTEARHKTDRFEVRDSNTMACVWFRRIPAPRCVGVLSFTDTIWLVGVFDYHKVFILNGNDEQIQEYKMTDPGRSTLRGMALVDQGTVVMRTAETVIFIDLLH